MEALHLIKKDPTKTIEDSMTSQSKLEMAYAQVSTYLERAKQTKANIDFKDHESVMTRMIYSLGQAALSELLSHYDISCDVIRIGEQTYRRKHLVPKEYQTALGPVTINRHVCVNRKKDGNGQSLCPLGDH